MKPDEHITQGLIHILKWNALCLTAHVSRVHDDSHGHTSAEVRLSSSDPGVHPHLALHRLSLTSDCARATFASQLEHDLGNSIPWRDIIEALCLRVISRLREESPTIKASDIPLTPLSFRLRPILIEHDTTIIFSPGGSGKSYLALFFASIIATDHPQCGFIPTPGPVLYLDWEDDPSTFRLRLNHLGFDSPPPIWYRHCTRPLSDPEVLNDILSSIATIHPGLVIIDSAGLACASWEIDSTLAFMTAIRHFSTTTLILDHVAKSRLYSKFKDPFGSIYKTNLARAVWEAVPSFSSSPSSFTLTLYHRKANRTPLFDPIPLAFSFVSDSLSISRLDSIPPSSTSTTEAILSLLHFSPLSAEDIASKLHTPLQSIKRLLRRLAAKNLVAKLDDGSWAVSPPLSGDPPF